jgi:predicted RNA binding protein YcfA (HicA-like mRNA interferase family)
MTEAMTCGSKEPNLPTSCPACSTVSIAATSPARASNAGLGFPDSSRNAMKIRASASTCYHRADQVLLRGEVVGDGTLPYRRTMAKAARILAALKRDGWLESRRSGSHRVLVKGDQQRIWAYQDGVDLGGPAMARIARDYGYTVDELRKL